MSKFWEYFVIAYCASLAVIVLGIASKNIFERMQILSTPPINSDTLECSSKFRGCV